MRSGLLATLLHAALLIAAMLPGVASGHPGDGCWEHVALGPSPNAGASVEHGTCVGESWSVAVNDPNGRTEIRWYDDERGVGIEAHRPPRFVAWWTDSEGCHLILYAFGAEELPCVAGDAPSPTMLRPLLP